MPCDRQVLLADGTGISYLEGGRPDAPVVLFLHGTPGSRMEVVGPIDRAAVDLGLRLIAPDRPGCGNSSFLRYRVADYPRLVARFADALGVGGFAVVGTSGGGRYAAACASGLLTRVNHLVLVGATAPVELPGARQTWSSEDRLAYTLAVRTPWLFRAWMARLARDLERHPDRWRKALPILAEADQRALERPEVGQLMRSMLTEAFRQGGRGVARDYQLEALPWGCDLTAVTAPVDIWHGRDDTLVDVGAADILAAALPVAERHIVPGEGHFSLILEHAADYLAPLAA